MSGVAQWTRGAGGNSANGPVIESSGSLRLQNGGLSQSAPHMTSGSGDLILSVNASMSSSLYQENLNEVRVNALFGLSLIRAY